MIKQETAIYDFQMLGSNDSRFDSSEPILPTFSLLNSLLTIFSSIGWIVLGTIITIYGFVDMFARMAMLTAGMHRLLRRPPSVGRILLGGTMIFAGSMDLFMKSVLCTSCIREQFAKISLEGIYSKLSGWFTTSENLPMHGVVDYGTDGTDVGKSEVTNLFHINPNAVYKLAEHLTPQEWPEFSDIDIASSVIQNSYNTLHLQYVRGFD